MSVSVPTSTLEKFTTFGDLLRFLRRRVGITQSELAAVVGYSDGQISRLQQNLCLPDPSTISSRFVPAEREALRQRQLEAVQKLAEAEGQRAEEQARAAGQLRKRALYLATALAVALIMGVTALFFAAQSRRAVRTEQAQPRKGLF